MQKKILERILLAVVSVVLLLALAAAAALHYGAEALKSRVEEALGPDSEVGAVNVAWTSIVIDDVRIRAPAGWPAQDALRAKRIVVVPDLNELLSASVRINRIIVEDAYLSVLRTREGRMRLLPDMLERPRKAGTEAAPRDILIRAIQLRGGVVEFFDASIRATPHKMRMEQIHGDLTKLRLPALTGRSDLLLTGKLKGARTDGKLAFKGWMELATKNSELSMELENVDLVTMQPYLIKASETGVRRGTLDLKLRSTVRNQQLHAPGTLTLKGLELESSGPLGTFMGMPRQAVLAGMKDRKDRIMVPFTLDGRLDDPQFSLNDSLARRIGAGMAGLLGITIEGLAREAGSAAQGIGGAMRKLFGK
ncbi:MAG: hypothetical protein K0S28_343 [Paucimonas sp.]|nr:hypothetical protein [Paucimonas sp.]